MKDTSPSIYPTLNTEMQCLEKGAPAVPCQVQTGGMTLLQFYAGQALACIADKYSGEPDAAVLVAHRCKKLAAALVKEVLE